jgi:hypothetical protein
MLQERVNGQNKEKFDIITEKLKGHSQSKARVATRLE